jgi:hypothetical protein
MFSSTERGFFTQCEVGPPLSAENGELAESWKKFQPIRVNLALIRKRSS